MGRVVMNDDSLMREMHNQGARKECEECAPERLGKSDTDSSDVFQRRRELARSTAGTVSIPEEFDAKRERARRIEQKYGNLL